MCPDHCTQCTYETTTSSTHCTSGSCKVGFANEDDGSCGGNDHTVIVVVVVVVVVEVEVAIAVLAASSSNSGSSSSIRRNGN